MLIWLLTACGPEPTAILFADVTDQFGQSIPNPQIKVYDASGTLIHEIEGDTRGNFTTDLPPNATFYLVISADDFETHSFTGQAETGEISPETGALWLRTPDAVETLKSDFTFCSHTESSFVDGQARLYLDGLDTPAAITTATILIEDVGKTQYPACYLPETDSETGEEIEAETTGETGQFAVFGLSEGRHTIYLEAMVEDADAGGMVPVEYSYSIYVPDNGSVPKYPLLVPFETE